MSQIQTMIEHCASNLSENRSKARAENNWAMPWLHATRLHALLDCYAALGGDISRWRKASNVLRQDF